MKTPALFCQGFTSMDDTQHRRDIPCQGCMRVDILAFVVRGTQQSGVVVVYVDCAGIVRQSEQLEHFRIIAPHGLIP